MYRLVMLFVVAMMSFACAGSFEEAQLAGLKAKLPTAVAAIAPSARCVSLDSQHRTWGAIGKGAAVLAGAEGLVAIPIDSKGGRIALATGTAVTAAVAATAVYISEDAATTWAEECSLTP